MARTSVTGILLSTTASSSTSDPRSFGGRIGRPDLPAGADARRRDRPTARSPVDRSSRPRPWRSPARTVIGGVERDRPTTRPMPCCRPDDCARYYAGGVPATSGAASAAHRPANLRAVRGISTSSLPPIPLPDQLPRSNQPLSSPEHPLPCASTTSSRRSATRRTCASTDSTRDVPGVGGVAQAGARESRAASIKDRIGIAMIEDAERRGVLKPGA